MTAGTEHGLDSLAEAGEVAALAKRHWNQSRQLKRYVESIGRSYLCLKLISIDGEYLSHLCTVRNIKFSPDGDTVISGSTDNTVKIWKLDFASLAANKSVYQFADFSIRTTDTSLPSGTLERVLSLNPRSPSAAIRPP